MYGSSMYSVEDMYSFLNSESIIRIGFSPEKTWFCPADLKAISDMIKAGNINSSIVDLCETPDNIKIPLKMHQKRILAEMIKKENSKWRTSSGINMCVLADKVGSGKSMDILALIAKTPIISGNNLIQNKIKYRVTSSNPFCGLKFAPSVNFKTNLLVVPHGIYNQWQTYIERDTNLNYIGLTTKKSVINLDLNELIEGKYTIVLVKSSRYNELMDKINDKYPKEIEYRKNYNYITGLEELSYEWNKDIHLMNRLYYQNDYGNNLLFLKKLQSLKIAFDNLDMKLIKSSIDKASKFKIFNIANYKGPLFERVIFDETDSINISNSRAAYGKFNWFVTSSLESLIQKGVRRRGFLKEVFKKNSSYQNCNFIQDMYLKNSDTYVDNSFNLPDPIFNKLECFTPEELKILKGVALPQIMDALNAGDLETAITVSGCEVTTTTNIVDIVLGNLIDTHEKIAQKIELYEKKLVNLNVNLQEKKNEIEELNELKELVDVELTDELLEKIRVIKEEDIPKIKSKISSKKDSIKNLKQKLSETLNKIESIKARITNISEKTCPVCADTVNCPALTPCCKNYFCLECIGTALTFKKICPLCRKPLKLKDMTIIKEDDVISSSSVSDEDRLPTKQERLIELINSNKEGRFLVFSSYDNSFNTVRELLNKEKIPWSKLCGNTYQINSIIKKYSENKIRVLLLNAKYYGSGFNLQMTTDIVIYHRMEADLEKQIIGRGQRLGRTTPLNVNYLCYETEL